MRIYASVFKLKFHKKEIENDYVTNKNLILLRYVKFQTAILFFLTLASIITLSQFTKDLDNNKYKAALIISSILAMFYVITIIAMLFVNKINFLRFMNYTNYYFLLLTWVNIRYPLFYILKIHGAIFSMIFTGELILRICFVIFGFLGFFEYLILNAMTLITSWCLYGVLSSAETLLDGMLLNCLYTFLLIMITFVTYFFEKKDKTAFYFKYEAEKKAKWAKNVLDNMNTGFISIQGCRVPHINNFIYNKFMNTNIFKMNDVNDHILVTKDTEENISKGVLHHDTIIKNIILTLNTDSLNDDQLIKNISDLKYKLQNSMFHSKSPRSLMKEYFSQIVQISDFRLIGDFSFIDEDKIENSFEVYCRYNLNVDNEEEIEFLFNDVTRTKLIEQQKSEMKYKTMFFAKIAHEFKNPLICIIELIQRLSEMHTESNQLNRTLHQIKSLSNFLLILVKDLDHFSQTEFSKNILLDKRDVNMDLILDFCDSIANVLIEKYNKINEVKFKIKKGDNLPENIKTDEWKLKQVLVNLISNAVKFTLHGKITLKINLIKKEDNNYVKFLIKDTGSGIKDEEKEKIFKPLSKGNEKYNDLGMGLGLSIVSDILSKLETTIEFESKHGVGTSFWFLIQIEDVNTIQRSSSQSTLKNDQGIYLNRDNLRLDNNESFQYFNDSSCSSSFDSIGYKKICPKPKDNLFRDQPLQVCSILDLITENFFKKRFGKKLRNKLNFILADDELFSRLSTIRIFSSVLKEIKEKQNIHYNINIFEAEDGIETVYIIYMCLRKGIRINFVISDETMNFVNGTQCCSIVNEVTKRKNINKIPFYLLSAYDKNFIQTQELILDTFSKPITKEMCLKLIFSHIQI